MNGIYLVRGEYKKGDEGKSLLRKLAYKHLKKLRDEGEGNLYEIGDFKTFVNQSKIEVNQHGKPFFVGKYEDLNFSISHSGEYYAVVFSDYPCGIDVQEIKAGGKPGSLGKIAQKYFTKEEMSYIKSDADFFQIWTAREAYGKMVGDGFWGEMPNFVEAGSLIDRVTYGASEYLIRELEIDPKYILKLCLVDEAEYVEFAEASEYEENAPDGRLIAAKYLGRSARSTAQLRKHLKTKGVSESEINQVIEEFTEFGYLNDAVYAVQFFEYGENKGWGRTRILRELKNRGVSQDDIEEAESERLENLTPYEDKDFNSEEGRALGVAQKMVSSKDFEESRLTEKAKARIARRLYGYGYTWDTIKKVQREIDNEHSDEE